MLHWEFFCVFCFLFSVPAICTGYYAQTRYTIMPETLLAGQKAHAQTVCLDNALLYVCIYSIESVKTEQVVVTRSLTLEGNCMYVCMYLQQIGRAHV